MFENAADNKDLLLSVCKFIDTALILLPQHLQLFKWLFVQDAAANQIPRNLATKSTALNTTFVPQLQVLAQRLNAIIAKNETSNKSKGFGTGFNSNQQKRRPVLLMRSIESVQQLAKFHAIVSAVDQKRLQTVEVDMEFLNQLILSDFIESDSFPNLLVA